MDNGNRNGGDLFPCVLVVDDSVETLQIVERTFRKAGYPVWTAVSGEEAL